MEGAEGRVAIEVPQVRGVPGYHSRLLEFLGAHSEVLEQLVTERYARGLSTREIGDAFTDATGAGLLSRSAVSELTDSLWEEYEAFCRRALPGFAEDLEASLAHLRVPPAHRKFVRTTNLIERSFEEQRRRTKVIPRCFDERSCRKRAYAALQQAAERWQKVTTTELQERQRDLRAQQLQPDPHPSQRQSIKLAA